jgi:hypothetical protein
MVLAVPGGTHSKSLKVEPLAVMQLEQCSNNLVMTTLGPRAIEWQRQGARRKDAGCAHARCAELRHAGPARRSLAQPLNLLLAIPVLLRNSF